jgi:hypothetical protein
LRLFERQRRFLDEHIVIDTNIHVVMLNIVMMVMTRERLCRVAYEVCVLVHLMSMFVMNMFVLMSIAMNVSIGMQRDRRFAAIEAIVKMRTRQSQGDGRHA